MRKFTTKSLLFILATLFSSPFSRAQLNGDNAPPKGEFFDAYIQNVNLGSTETVYSADAQKMGEQFTSTDFSVKSTDGESVYCTDAYSANSNFVATSPVITLPAVEGKQKIMLKISESFRTESAYDFISIKVNGDEIYKKSGKATSATDYVDLTYFAGSDIRLTLALTSDGSIHGDAWEIGQIEILKGEKQVSAAAPRRAPRAAATASGNTVKILSVNTDTYPEAVFVTFTVTDSSGDFVAGLTENDISILDDGTKKYGCLKMMQTTEKQLAPTDIVLLVDNSGSMGEHQAKVDATIRTFLDSLKKHSTDARVGLMRFGQSTKPSCPDYAVKERGFDNKFFHRMEKLDYFKDNVWTRNEASGYYEPYYEVLNWAANQPIDYRQNARKAFIMLGDEYVNDGTNNKTCNGNPSTLTASAVANKLKGIQTFFIIDRNYYSADSEFSPIATATGGIVEDIRANSYDAILDKFSSSITQVYTLRYCLDIDKDKIDPSEKKTVTVQLNESGAIDTMSYYPIVSPTIVRTPETQNLDNSTQNDNAPVTIGATVILNNHTLESFKIYYRNGSDASDTYKVVTKTASEGVMSADGKEITFTFDIPASDVQPPLIKYYFTADANITTDGTNKSVKVSSPPNNSDFFAWTFAVKPNYAPVISNVVAPQKAYSCSPTPLSFCADVTDLTDYVASVSLYYKVKKTPNIFANVPMSKNPSGDTYCAEVPGTEVQEDDIEWYIVATDNYGTTSLHGTPENPKIIEVNKHVPTSPTGHEMGVIINPTNISLGCSPIRVNDMVNVYFTNSCGNLQLAGSNVFNGMTGFDVKVYGDSDPNDGFKDGFDEGEEVILKVIRNGIDYRLNVSPVIYYSSKTTYVHLTAVGVPIPTVSVFGNGNAIEENATPNTNNNTDFGNVHCEATKTFTLENTGCDSLLVKSINSTNPAFTIVNFQEYTKLAVGDSLTFGIRYEASADADAVITVFSNADNDPFKFNIKGTAIISSGISVSGNGNAIEADAEPDTSNNTDFGEVQGEVTKTFTLKNTGCNSLLVETIESTNGAFTIVDFQENTKLAVDGSLTFGIRYDASANAEAEISITTDADDNPFAFKVKGTVLEPEPKPENFCDQFNYFPNPVAAGGTVIFNFPIANNNASVSVSLMTLSGTQVKSIYQSNSEPAGIFLRTFDVNGIPAGSYILMVVVNGNVCAKILQIN